MKTIYLVSQGEYSDYHICGAFSSEEAAQFFIDNSDIKGEYDEMRIEPHNLDPFINEMKSGLSYFFVRMGLNGDNAYTDKQQPTSWDREYINKNRNYFYTHCWAKDETHAIKIANERRIQAIANQNG